MDYTFEHCPLVIVMGRIIMETVLEIEERMRKRQEILDKLNEEQVEDLMLCEELKQE